MHRCYRNNCQNKIGKNYELHVQKSLPGKRRSHAKLLVMNVVNLSVQKREVLFKIQYCLFCFRYCLQITVVIRKDKPSSLNVVMKYHRAQIKTLLMDNDGF